MGRKKSVKRAMSVDDLNLSEVSPTGVPGKATRKRVCKSRRNGGVGAVASTQPVDPPSSLGVSQMDPNNQHGVSESDDDDDREIQSLKSEVTVLKNTIATLTTQINFLLSFVGAVDSAPPTIHTQTVCGLESAAVPVQSGQGASASAHSCAEISRQPSTQVPGVGVGVGGATMREAAVTAMYMEKAERDRREASLIATGFPTSNSASDRESVSRLIESEFDVRPDINFTKRLGQRLSDKPQPLLVYLKDTAQAQHIVSQARQLRHSRDEYV